MRTIDKCLISLEKGTCFNFSIGQCRIQSIDSIIKRITKKREDILTGFDCNFGSFIIRFWQDEIATDGEDTLYITGLIGYNSYFSLTKAKVDLEDIIKKLITHYLAAELTNTNYRTNPIKRFYIVRFFRDWVRDSRSGIDHEYVFKSELIECLIGEQVFSVVEEAKKQTTLKSYGQFVEVAVDGIPYPEYGFMGKLSND